MGGVVEIDIERNVEKDGEVKKEKESIYINIPNGVENNEVVTLHNKGNIIDDRQGEIRIVVSIENSTEFLRQGLDIILKRSITLKEALCGFVLEFVFLNGKKMAINNKENYSIIKPGYPGCPGPSEHQTILFTKFPRFSRSVRFPGCDVPIVRQKPRKPGKPNK